MKAEKWIAAFNKKGTNQHILRRKLGKLHAGCVRQS